MRSLHELCDQMTEWWHSGSPAAKTARTAFQTVAGFVLTAVGLQVVSALTVYQSSHVLDISGVWYDGIVAGVAAGLAYLMNRGKRTQ